MKKSLLFSSIGISLLIASVILSPGLVPAKQAELEAEKLVLVGYSGNSNSQARAVVESYGGTVTATFNFVNVIGARIPTSEEKTISHSLGISYVKEQAIAHIDSIEGVGSIGIDSHLDTTQETPYGVDMVNAEGAWNLGYTGQGVRIAILDTGLDFNHPDKPTNVNMELSYDFVNEDADPQDDDGHGTHVAGTIAAPDNGIGVVGVAPGAEIVVLKVCDANGQCSEEDLMQAMEHSMVIGADIISMSLGGSGFNTPGQGQGTTAWKHLHTMAYNQGILIVAASGNTGTQEVDHYPSAFSEVISVGSVDSNKQLSSFSTYGAHQELVAPGGNVLSTLPLGYGTETTLTETDPTVRELQANSMSFSPNGDVTGELFYAGLGGVTGLGDISDYDLDGDGLSDAVGKVALVSRGQISFLQKAYNALVAGATAVIIFNNNPGNFFGTLQISYPWAPTVSISQADGLALLAEVGTDNTGSVTVHLVIESSNYGYLSGTSMATPHVAAVAALVMSANPNLSNLEVRQLLHQMAENLGSPGQRDIVYGWGLVDAYAAVLAALP